MPCEGPPCVGRSSIYDVTGLGNGSHRRQLTFEYLDTSTGELEGGRVVAAGRQLEHPADPVPLQN